MALAAIPPRLSVNDPDFDPRVSCELEIRLNGVLQDCVLSYDLEAGIVERLERGATGEYVIDHTRGKAATEIVHGDVTVRRRPSIAALKRLLTVANLMTLAGNKPRSR